MAGQTVTSEYRRALEDIVYFLTEGRRVDLALKIAIYALDLAEERKRAAAERRARKQETAT